MATLTKVQAQTRADQIRAFREEQQLLTEQGLLNLALATRIEIERFHNQVLTELQQQQDIDLNESAKSLSLGMQIVSFLGASALAASLFFLFYQYWGYFSTASQVMVLVLAPLVTLGVATWLTKLDSSGYYAKLAALVSFASWVLNLIMLGSIFNITPSPNAFAAFAIYGFLLAYLLQVRLLLAAGIICVFIYIGAELGTWMGGYWIYLGERPEHFFLPALLVFGVPILIKQDRYHGFESLFQILSALGLMLAVLILANWGSLSYLSWPNSIIEGFYQLLGFILSALLVLYGLRTHAAKIMLTGNVFFALFLFTKFFDWWWDWLPKYVFFLLIGLTSILAMVIFNRLRKEQQGVR